jgi:hypothetical protein
MVRRTMIGLWKSIVIGNIIFAVWASGKPSSPTPGPQDKLKSIVDRAIQPVMLNYSIAGMAVGLNHREKHGCGLCSVDGAARVFSTRD